MRLPDGALNTQLPLVRKGALVVLAVDERTRSCVGHWSAIS
jgi:hypothetical protein